MLIHPNDTQTLTGADRYVVYPTGDGTFHVYDHEDGEYMADGAGTINLTEEDARDLAAEYIG